MSALKLPEEGLSPAFARPGGQEQTPAPLLGCPLALSRKPLSSSGPCSDRKGLLVAQGYCARILGWIPAVTDPTGILQEPQHEAKISPNTIQWKDKLIKSQGIYLRPPERTKQSTSISTGGLNRAQMNLREPVGKMQHLS